MSFFSIGILIVVVAVAFRIAPREKKDQAQIHGAGQIAMLAALALFGADFFTSYFYGTGEMMSVLWPYHLQAWGLYWRRRDRLCKRLFRHPVHVLAGPVQ